MIKSSNIYLQSNESNEQKLIDLVFDIGLTIHNSKRLQSKNMSDKQVAEWIAKQLRDNGFNTEPCGMSWGILKEKNNGK